MKMLRYLFTVLLGLDPDRNDRYGGKTILYFNEDEDPCKDCPRGIYEPNEENCEDCPVFDEDEDPCADCDEEDCEGCPYFDNDEDPCDDCPRGIYEPNEENCEDCPVFDLCEMACPNEVEGANEMECGGCPHYESDGCESGFSGTINTNSGCYPRETALEKAARRISQAAGRNIEVKTYQSGRRNACATKETVYVSSKATDDLNEAELAFFIAHEVAHQDNDDFGADRRQKKEFTESVVNAYQSSKGFFSGMAKAVISGLNTKAEHCAERRYSELKADAKAKELVRQAGYDPNACEDALKKSGFGGGRIFDNHPSTALRVRFIKDK